MIGRARPQDLAPNHARGRDEAIVEAVVELEVELLFQVLADLGCWARRGIDLRCATRAHVERREDRGGERVDRRPQVLEQPHRSGRRHPGGHASISKVWIVLDARIEDIHRLRRELNDRALIASNPVKPLPHFGLPLFPQKLRSTPVVVSRTLLSIPSASSTRLREASTGVRTVSGGPPAWSVM